MKWLRAVVIAPLLLAGCVSTPPQIANPPAQPLSVSEATEHLAEHLHQPVRWGGIILSVTPQPEEIWIEIEARPLGHQGHPNEDAASLGRFYARLPATRMDPDLRSGRLITLYGTLSDEATQQLGNHRILLPVMTAEQFSTWERRAEQPPALPRYPYGWPYPPYYLP